MYDFKTGMLNNSKTAYLSIIKAHSDYLHLMVYDEKKANGLHLGLEVTETQFLIWRN